MTRKEPQIDFLTGLSACRSDLQKALNDYLKVNKVSFGQGDFWGYRYEIPQEAEKSVIRVFCGAKEINESGSDVMLRVSVHPADQEGISANPWGSQEYILRNDDTIVVKKDDRGDHLIDGTKQEHLEILNKVQALAEEAKAKLDTLILKKAPSIAS